MNKKYEYKVISPFNEDCHKYYHNTQNTNGVFVEVVIDLERLLDDMSNQGWRLKNIDDRYRPPNYIFEKEIN